MADGRSRIISDDGRTVMIQAELSAVVAVAKGAHGDGDRLAIVVALGTDLDDADFYALSVPDVHELVRKLERALADPAPQSRPKG